MIDLINENYSLLLLLQHFEIEFTVGNKTVEQLCEEYNVDLPSFLIISKCCNKSNNE
jgi:regulator of cell morphogenesis and NO signaling